jgi:hypothetical protein
MKMNASVRGRRYLTAKTRKRRATAMKTKPGKGEGETKGQKRTGTRRRKGGRRTSVHECGRKANAMQLSVSASTENRTK